MKGIATMFFMVIIILVVGSIVVEASKYNISGWAVFLGLSVVIVFITFLRKFLAK